MRRLTAPLVLALALAAPASALAHPAPGPASLTWELAPHQVSATVAATWSGAWRLTARGAGARVRHALEITVRTVDLGYEATVRYLWLGLDGRWRVRQRIEVGASLEPGGAAAHGCYRELGLCWHSAAIRPGQDRLAIRLDSFDDHRRGYWLSGAVRSRGDAPFSLGPWSPTRVIWVRL